VRAFIHDVWLSAHKSGTDDYPGRLYNDSYAQIVPKEGVPPWLEKAWAPKELKVVGVLVHNLPTTKEVSKRAIHNTASQYLSIARL
jgi:hypothetical protein